MKKWCQKYTQDRPDVAELQVLDRVGSGGKPLGHMYGQGANLQGKEVRGQIFWSHVRSGRKLTGER